MISLKYNKGKNWSMSILTRNYKGLYFSFGKFWKGVYMHFPKRTYRIYYSNKRINIDSYCTKGFNKLLKIEQ